MNKMTEKLSQKLTVGIAGKFEGQIIFQYCFDHPTYILFTRNVIIEPFYGDFNGHRWSLSLNFNLWALSIFTQQIYITVIHDERAQTESVLQSQIKKSISVLNHLRPIGYVDTLELYLTNVFPGKWPRVVMVTIKENSSLAI